MNVSKTLYTYVSKGALSIGEIKFWGKVARRGGGLIFVKGEITKNYSIRGNIWSYQRKFLSYRRNMWRIEEKCLQIEEKTGFIKKICFRKE